MTENSDDNAKEFEQNESRRQFIRRVGGSIFAIKLVDIIDGSSHEALAAACGTPGPAPFGEADLLCSIFIADNNCGVSQLPNNKKDHDQYCLSLISTAADNSCGDCDDKHDADQHCGGTLPNGQTDADEMCGHQSNIGGDQDGTCSATTADSGCGTHNHVYGPLPFEDPDQHCVGTNTDQNCSKMASDATCNSKTHPSTTSPDENCGTITGDKYDRDEACSHYDPDAACGFNAQDNDQACGTYGIFTDKDQHCPTAANDNTEDPNKGPLNPWCPSTQDADYWNPPPPQS